MKNGACRTEVTLVAAITLAVALSATADARSRRREHDETATVDSVQAPPAHDTSAAAAATKAKQRGSAPATFLDSANRGREARLIEADFAAPQSIGGRDRKGGDSAATAAALAPTPPRTSPAPAREVYRIQCMAATQSDGLESARNAIGTKVPYPVHIMHSPPYYKLLVGEFATRTEAERALYDVRGCGYPDAWIVRGIAGEGGESPQGVR
jgi:hypothetical protein